MSRNYCTLCERPLVSCICHLISPVENDIHVVVLQHPSEVKQAKGSVTLLHHSLSSCDVFVGEDFSENTELSELLKRYKEQITLVYPSEDAETIDGKANNELHAIRCIILLDGTWKKAFRLYMMNKWLYDIPHIQLPKDIENHYLIRKTKKSGALSTLEACIHTLKTLDNDKTKYQKLLTNFEQFNQMLLAFRPDKK